MKLIILTLCLFGAVLAKECPDCVWNFGETIDTYSVRMLTEAGGQLDGTCRSGYHVWWHFGEDYGFNYNSCCCLPSESNDGDCPTASACRYINRFHRNQTVIGFYADMIDDDNIPDGCCPEGSYKYIFGAEVYQAFGIPQDQDICGCIHDYERVENY